MRQRGFFSVMFKYQKQILKFMDAYFIHYKSTGDSNGLPASIRKELLANDVKFDFECSEHPILIAIIPDEKIDTIRSLEGIVKVDIVPEDLT